METRINKVTLVSGLFYIGRDRWKHSSFPPGYDRYKGWIHNILSLDTDLILFTDEYYYDHILKVKEKYISSSKNLHLVKLSLANLETYQKYYNKISCVMKTPEFVNYVKTNKVAEMCYPLYNVIMFDKVSLLERAQQIDPFQTTHFYWTDAGAFRDDLEKYKDVKWPDNYNTTFFNDKVTFFSHRGTEYSIDNQKNYFTSQARVVHGGYFIVPKEKINFLKQEFNRIADEILNDGYIGSDEKVFDLICKRHSTEVSMIKAGWFEFYPMCSYVKEEKSIEIQKNNMKITAVAATWGHSDSSNFEQSHFYRSFKHFNPDKEAINFHFNRTQYTELENEFNQRFGYQYEGILYRIYLILDKIKELDTDYIITSDTQDVVCLRNVDHLLGLFDLENNVIFGMERNDWPKKVVRDTWEGYTDFDEFHIRNSYYLNASVVLVKKEVYINFLQSIIDNIFPSNAKDVSDQGMFSWHYNTKALPQIKLDTSSLFVVSTYNRPLEDYYMHDNKLYSNHNGIAPCFVHDNGFQWGSPQYQVKFNLYKLYP